MITITFDDAVNNENWDLYQRLFFKGRKNPNGCNIHATFYLSHEFTNYAYVQRLWNEGHEIAVHSITWVNTCYNFQFKLFQFLFIFNQIKYVEIVV